MCRSRFGLLMALLMWTPAPGSGQDRVTDWAQSLTLSEKAALLTGKNDWETLDISRLDLPSIWMADGPAGLRKDTAAAQGVTVNIPATVFPSAGGLAATWNPHLIEEVGRSIGAEAISQNVTLVLAPGLNLKRHPLGGRNFEYYSEDPFLSGTMAGAFVRGVQSQGVGATLKHFAVNNQEHRRMVIDARVGDRALHELYLRGFEIAVRDARPAAVMTAYNRVNGTPASSDPFLLTRTLRQEWGFEGLVVSDWIAVNDPVEAIRAGLDLEMPANTLSPLAIESAVREGRLPIEDVDRAAMNVLRLVTLRDRMPPTGPAPDQARIHRIAEEAATESIVLLSNKGALPLDPARHRRLGVVGRLADSPRIQGIGSSQVTPRQVDTIRAAVESLGNELGFEVGGWFPDYAEEGLSPAEAEDLGEFLAQVDLVVAVVGQEESHDAEAGDRPSIALSEADQAIVGTALGMGVPLVAVVVGGASVDLAPLADADAVLFGWLGGGAFGTALAKILFGQANPSGRLSETFALSVSDHASNVNFPGGPWAVDYGEGLYVGYRYFHSFDRPVAYPFGHGLSYTSFEYLEGTSPNVIRNLNGPFDILVEVENTGDRPGLEVVQVYLRHLSPSLERPDRELAGFRKVMIEPGEVRRVRVSVDPDRLAYFHDGFQRWVIEPGDYEILVGPSSGDIRLSMPLSVEVGTMPAFEFTLDHTLGELSSDQGGKAVVDLIMSAWGRGSISDADPDDFMMAILRDLPFRKLANVSEGAISGEMLLEFLGMINSRMEPSEIQKKAFELLGGGVLVRNGGRGSRTPLQIPTDRIRQRFIHRFSR